MCPSPPSLAGRVHHERVDPRRHASWLSDVVLGGQDGLVWVAPSPEAAALKLARDLLLVWK